MQASILKGDEILFEDLKVSLVEESRDITWGGFAFLPPQADIDPGEYELRLEDGRSGVVAVVSVREGIAMFRGWGPLARAHDLQRPVPPHEVEGER